MGQHVAVPGTRYAPAYTSYTNLLYSFVQPASSTIESGVLWAQLDLVFLLDYYVGERSIYIPVYTVGIYLPRGARTYH